VIEDILREVLARVKPTREEGERLRATVKEIIARLDATAKAKQIDAYAIHVGSTARDTWLRGTKDLDIFLMFPPDAPADVLENAGLELARTLSPEYEERYAEHPYVTTQYEGLDVDLVPCYNVEDPAHIISAVDRSPFHNRYVQSHINGLCDEVRLLKQFTRGAGVYGSELKTQGFSGYLCELLIIKYGSFLNVVKNGSIMRHGRVIDIEGHMDRTVEHPDPLIVIDPVDPRRNVAAALSEQKFCEFIEACRRFLNAPSLGLFFPPSLEPIDSGDLARLMSERGTLLVAVAFKTPDIVEDTLYPQLRKAEESVVRMLERNEFIVYRSGVWSGERSAIVLEMLVWQLPRVERHWGPPVHEKEHCEKFKEKYPNAYIMGCKLAVDISRKYTTAAALIEGQLTACGLGKQVAGSIAEGFVLLFNEDALGLGPGFAAYLPQLLHP
jgi:tRNA nucleotidyltransferase (CCA-adding enzyme)